MGHGGGHGGGHSGGGHSHSSSHSSHSSHTSHVSHSAPHHSGGSSSHVPIHAQSHSSIPSHTAGFHPGSFSTFHSSSVHQTALKPSARPPLSRTTPSFKPPAGVHPAFHPHVHPLAAPVRQNESYILHKPRKFLHFFFRISLNIYSTTARPIIERVFMRFFFFNNLDFNKKKKRRSTRRKGACAYIPWNNPWYDDWYWYFQPEYYDPSGEFSYTNNITEDYDVRINSPFFI